MASPHVSQPEVWPVLDGGAAGVATSLDGAWRHDGYRMHLGGHGHRLEWVRSDMVLMDDVRHDDGTRLVLHADRVELSRNSGTRDRWLTALELPLFAWEREAGGTVSWSIPEHAVTEPSADRTRLVVRSPEARAPTLFETTTGSLAVSEDGRVTWTTDARARLVAVSATDRADFDRTRDLFERRAVPGLGRQRAQHAEQLHRGGAAMRAAGIPQLDLAFEWAKIRADALLGAWLAGSPRGPAAASATALRLAEGLLAAGLSHLPRALRRLIAAEGAASRAFTRAFDAWAAEAHEATTESRTYPEDPAFVPTESPFMSGTATVEALASGRADAEAVASFLTGALGSLWGIEADARRESVRLAPDLVRLGPSAALSRLRVGRSVLDVRLRRLGEVVSISVRRGAGPPIMLECTVRGSDVREMLVDGEAVGGDRARFDARDAHDIQLHLGASPPLSSPPS